MASSMVWVIVLLLGVFASVFADLSVTPNARTGCLPLIDNSSQSVEFLIFNGITEIRNFASAKTRCPQIGAGLTLARIDESKHLEAVQAKLNSISALDVWVGVEARDPSKNSDKATDFVYSDGITTHLSFLQVTTDGTLPWAKDEPNGPQEDCGEIQGIGKLLNDEDCIEAQGFICRVDCPPTNAPTRSPTRSPTKSPTRSPTRSPTKKTTFAPTKSPTKKPTIVPSKSPTPKPTLAPGETLSPSDTPTKLNATGQVEALKKNFNVGMVATAVVVSILAIVALLAIFALVRRRQNASKPMINPFNEINDGQFKSPEAMKNDNGNSQGPVINDEAIMKARPGSYSLKATSPKKQERVPSDLVTRVTAPVIISSAAAERHGAMLLIPTISTQPLNSPVPPAIEPVMKRPIVKAAPPIAVTILSSAKHRKKDSLEVNLNASPPNVASDDDIGTGNPSIAYLDAITSIPGRPQSIFQPSTEYIDKATNKNRSTDIAKKKKKSSRPIADLEIIDLEL